jgi:hypothetical protein
MGGDMAAPDMGADAGGDMGEPEVTGMPEEPTEEPVPAVGRSKR